VAFDQETLFPLRIAFSPGHGSALFPLIGPNGEITIEYTDVRLGAPDSRRRRRRASSWRNRSTGRIRPAASRSPYRSSRYRRPVSA